MKFRLTTDPDPRRFKLQVYRRLKKIGSKSHPKNLDPTHGKNPGSEPFLNSNLLSRKPGSKSDPQKKTGIQTLEKKTLIQITEGFNFNIYMFRLIQDPDPSLFKLLIRIRKPARAAPGLYVSRPRHCELNIDYNAL